MPDQSTPKICIVCGTDCAGRPRTKDPQGRYFCQPCYEKAMERKRQARTAAAREPKPISVDPSEETDADEEASILDEVVAQARPVAPPVMAGPCEACGAPMPEGAIICTSCGYNMQTGETIKIRTVEKKADWAADTGMFISPAVVGIGLMAAFALLMFLGRTMPTAGLILVIGVALVSFVTWVAALIFAFQRTIGQGLLTLLVPFYIIWFVYGVNDNSYLKWTFGGALVGYACQVGLVALFGVDALDAMQQQMGGF